MANNNAMDLEFERNRQEVLNMAQRTSKKNAPVDESNRLSSENKQAVWEYEIIEHRKKENREKFMMFGSICGIIGLMLSITLLINNIYKFF